MYAAIAALIADPRANNWRTHANVIARFAADMPKSGVVRYKHKSRRVTERVERSDDGEETWRIPVGESEVKERSFGVNEVWLGGFILVRSPWNRVEIRTSDGQNPNCYLLRLDEKGQPRDFGIEIHDLLFSFTLFSTFYRFSFRYTRILTDKGGRWGWGLVQEAISPPP